MVQLFSLFSTSSLGGTLLALGLGLMLGWLAWCRPKTKACTSRRIQDMRDENAQLRALLRATQASAPLPGLLDPALGQGSIDRKTFEADLKHPTWGGAPGGPAPTSKPPVIHEFVESDRLADGDLAAPDLEEALARPVQNAALAAQSDDDLQNAGIAAAWPTEPPMEHILELEENLAAMRARCAVPGGHALKALPNMVQATTRRDKASRSLD